MARIGLMGGTFDPIHHGHLTLARETLYQMGLDEVWFIPNSDPPHKDRETASGHDRYIMVCLAVAGTLGFVASDLEVRSNQVSYTVDTVRRLPGGHSYSFITGADSLMVDWRDLDGVLSVMESFVVATRPGFTRKALDQRLDTLNLLHRDRIKFLAMPALDISSTDIRQRVSERRPIDFLVPVAVADYIAKQRLYLSAC